MTTKNVLVLPATLNNHKSSAFGWNGIMLLGYARRYKHYGNAPQCCVMHTLFIFFCLYILPHYRIAFYCMILYLCSSVPNLLAH